MILQSEKNEVKWEKVNSEENDKYYENDWILWEIVNIVKRHENCEIYYINTITLLYNIDINWYDIRNSK